MFVRGLAWTLLSFQTRMLRQWKDFLWMGHFMMLLTAISRIFCGISQSKKVSLMKIITSNIYVNKRDRQLEENIGKCG